MITMVLGASTVISAGDDACSQGSHVSTNLYSHVLMSKVKTGEQVVNLSNGMQATCYIYTEYYEDTYYCTTCHTMLPRKTSVNTNVHSLH